MRNDYIHLTMVIDNSGSMWASKEDVIGGFDKIISEQKKDKDGKVTVSLYTFNNVVKEEYVGKEIDDINKFEYNPMGGTAMNDGIGTAIDNTGKWLASMDESERPSKVLVAVFTDGMENASKEYTLSAVKEKIKHQTDVYSWEFIYMGTDITTSEAADNLGFKTKTFGSRKMMANNYNILNSAVSAYKTASARGMSVTEASLAFSTLLNDEAMKNTKQYEAELGKKITKL